MHIVSADVMSVNGKITKDAADSHSWTSAADWKHFKSLRDSHDLLVLGRGTYEVVQPQPEAAWLRIVLTHHPENFKDKTVPGQLEFLNKSPEQLIKLMEKRGFTRMLLLGGEVNTAFWAAGLVNEAFITIEPSIFGQGKNLAEGVDFSADLHLQSVIQLNKRGTLLLHYLVDNS
jgi:dihydrofolate reductase